MEGKTIASAKKTRLNDQIKVPEVRLIGADGNQVGIVSIEEARTTAQTSGMDLVEISPSAKPPVCRVMDYNKFLFEQRKNQAAAKKKQKQSTVKEIKFRPGTEEADLQVKLRSIIRFLETGDKVKITLRFRGREVVHSSIGFELMKRVEDEITEIGVVEFRPKMEGRQMTMVLAPKKK